MIVTGRFTLTLNRPENPAAYIRSVPLVFSSAANSKKDASS